MVMPQTVSDPLVAHLRRCCLRVLGKKPGCGFLVAPQLLITCSHVVGTHAPIGATVEVTPWHVTGLLGGMDGPDGPMSGLPMLGEVLVNNAAADLALLRLPASGEPHVALDQEVRVGDELLALGFPQEGQRLELDQFTADFEGEVPYVEDLAQRRCGIELKFKGGQVRHGFSGGPLLNRRTWRVIGVVAVTRDARSPFGGFAKPLADIHTLLHETGLTLPLAVDPRWSDAEALQRRSEQGPYLFMTPELLESCPGVRPQRKGRTDWRWPAVWDFRAYRIEKRHNFMGRAWLFREVCIWAQGDIASAGRPHALLIVADYGVGKTAFLAELIDTGVTALPIAAQHFCSTELDATLTPSVFVTSLAAQLADALTAYREALESAEAHKLRHLLDEAEQTKDPQKVLQAFDQAVLAPLLAIEAPPMPMLLVVDALDEAQDPRFDGSQACQTTILDLLARYANRLPTWLKLIATSRRRPDVLNTLRQGFALKELDAEKDLNLEDLRFYSEARCRTSPLVELIEGAGLDTTEVAAFLSSREQSRGKFLYVVRVLKDLETGSLPLAGLEDLEVLPPGLDKFYKLAFTRRFPSDESYAAVRDVLGALIEAREPIGRRDLAAILQRSEREIAAILQPLHDLLLLQPFTIQRDGVKVKETLHSFDHSSLAQWLSEEDEWFLTKRAGRFWVDRGAAAERIRVWALGEVEVGHAHTWPYLSRHLANHIQPEEQAPTVSFLLGNFSWICSRMREAGTNALVNDFSVANTTPALSKLEHAIRQAIPAIISCNSTISMEQQLCSQVLARLGSETEPELVSIRSDAEQRIKENGGAIPMVPSLWIPNATLYQKFDQSIGAIQFLQVLPNEVLASCSSVYNGWTVNIQLWDSESLATGIRKDDLAMHMLECRDASSLKTLQNHRLAFINQNNHSAWIWDRLKPDWKRLDHLFVSELEVLSDGTLATGCRQGKICLWDRSSQELLSVTQAHNGDIHSLLALPGDYLVSIAHEQQEGIHTIKAWAADGSKLDLLETLEVCAAWDLVLLQGKRIAFFVKERKTWDIKLAVWDLGTNNCCFLDIGPYRYAGGTRLVTSISDFQLLYAVGNDENMIMLDIDTGRIQDSGIRRTGYCVIAASLPSQACVALAGDVAIAGSESNEEALYLWSIKDNDVQILRSAYTVNIAAMTAHPNKLLYIGTRDGWIYSLNATCFLASTNRHLAICSGHNEPIQRLLEWPVGMIVSVSNSKVLRWDLQNLYLQPMRLAESDVQLLPPSPSKKLLLDSYMNMTFDGIPISCGQLLGAPAALPDKRIAFFWAGTEIVLFAHDLCTDTFSAHKVGFDYFNYLLRLIWVSETELVSVHPSKGIEIWDISGHADDLHPRTIDSEASSIESMIALPSSQIICGSQDGKVTMYGQAGSIGWRKTIVFSADHAITDLLYLSEGALLVAGDGGGRVHFLQLAPFLEHSADGP